MQWTREGGPGGPGDPGRAARDERPRERPSGDADPVDLDTWTWEELRARADAIDLPGRARMTRRQLIDELRQL